MLEIEAVRMEFPADANIIVGQSHLIKTVEDLYEAVSTTVPQDKFGLAFNDEEPGPLPGELPKIWGAVERPH